MTPEELEAAYVDVTERLDAMSKQLHGMRKLFFQERKKAKPKRSLAESQSERDWLKHYPKGTA